MAPDAFENEIIPASRPVFLKVLCMLTFIGSGYGIVNGGITYFKADFISNLARDTRIKVSDDLSKRRSNDTASVNFKRKIMTDLTTMVTPENLRKSSIGNVITSVFCLLGALLMWNLRRVGYYIYIAGTIVGITLPFYFFGSNFLTNISSGILGFIGILFIVFYGMNFKSMK